MGSYPADREEGGRDKESQGQGLLSAGERRARSGPVPALAAGWSSSINCSPAAFASTGTEPRNCYCLDPCMEGLVDYVKKQVKCPECRAEHRIPYNGIQGFPTNYTLT